MTGEPQPSSAVPDQPAPSRPGDAAAAVPGRVAESTPGKRQLREAENAYLTGAKKLQRNDLDAAEQEFVHALQLDPENRNYAIAISVARQHRISEMVQQATKARQAGDEAKARTILAQAQRLDPDNPLVMEHSGPFLIGSASAPQPHVPASGQTATGATTTLADRNQIILAAESREPWKIQPPDLAGAIHLAAAQGVRSFHLRAAAPDVIRSVATEFGIRAIIDDSVEQKELRFDLENVTYQQAISVLKSMAHVFTVPVDETSMLVAKDDAANRQRLERQVQETIYLPGAATDEINDLANVVRTIFDVKQATVETSLGSIVVRAPEDVLEPMNRTLQDLIDATGEVMIEVKMYEIDTTRMTNAGANLPTAFGVINFEAEAAQIVNANQAIVQQAIAQGLVPAGTSNLLIALALLKAGLVQSNILSTLLGTFGGGILMTGVTETGTVSFNIGLNTSDTRALDDVQLRVGDRQAATFREGNKYPIVSSTYSTGLSTAGSALSNATINGVSVSSLLQQYAGGTSATIPQITYEDLGVTLKATPFIQKTRRIKLNLDLKIEALGGSSANGNPILQSRQFTSDLTVADGESVLMVSNVTRNEAAAMAGIPGLSELPGFQAPTSDNIEKDTSQLVVVVTPHLVRIRSDLFIGPRIPVRNQAVN